MKLFAVSVLAVMLAGCAAHVCPSEDKYIPFPFGLMQIPKGYFSEGNGFNEGEAKAYLQELQRRQQVPNDPNRQF